MPGSSSTSSATCTRQSASKRDPEAPSEAARSINRDAPVGTDVSPQVYDRWFRGHVLENEETRDLNVPLGIFALSHGENISSVTSTTTEPMAFLNLCKESGCLLV
jgi:hypothetical protein